MKVKLKKNCNAEEHGLLGSAGEFIHVAKDEADSIKAKLEEAGATVAVQ